jgi:cold shock CspA family protein
MTENNEVGKVKFFNHKKGFGFIEIINPESKYVGTEQFVHFTEVKSVSDFKKLIPGEIVSLNVINKPGDDEKTVCSNVQGLYGSKLFIDSDEYIYRVRSKRSDNDDNNDNDNDNDVD